MPSATRLSTLPASATIPFAYRLILTTIEPIVALGGAAQLLLSPATYLAILTRNRGTFTDDSAFLYTEVGGAVLYFTFIGAVVLRCFGDARLWRLVYSGMLLSDAAYCHSVAQAVGGWASYSRIQDWTVEDYLHFMFTAFVVLTRILVVLGIGLKTGSAGSGHSKRA